VAHEFLSRECQERSSVAFYWSWACGSRNSAAFSRCCRSKDNEHSRNWYTSIELEKELWVKFGMTMVGTYIFWLRKSPELQMTFLSTNWVAQHRNLYIVAGHALLHNDSSL
jgi:hypothetical protein